MPGQTDEIPESLELGRQSHPSLQSLVDFLQLAIQAWLALFYAGGCE
jgi:hypothetical protein